MPPLLNDVQSQLNATDVHQVIVPRSVSDIQDAIHLSKEVSRPISIASNMHSMGGQQFCDQSIHLDLRQFNQVISFDGANGLIQVESGIEWPALINAIGDQGGGVWGIRQKQTGVDAVSLGGALSSNIHGRGLAFQPFISDVESFTLLDSEGCLLTCNRVENSELFSLAIGGYASVIECL